MFSSTKFILKGFTMDSTTFTIWFQIFFESLPISSSGHITLLGLTTDPVIDFIAHGPTALLLLIYFHREIFSCIREWKNKWREIIRLVTYVFVAELPTLFCFFFLHKYHLSIPLSLGFLISALLLLSLRFVRKTDFHSLEWREALVIGCVQGIALLPGISRLGSTYAVGRWLGLTPRTSFYFTCALQAPLFAGAFCLGMLIEFLDTGNLFSFVDGALWALLLGVALATLGAGFLLAFVERLIMRETLWYFGFYLFIPCLIAFIAGL